MATPKNVVIRAYQVGFGDCLLLTFEYANDQRHMLIDFGTVAWGDPEVGNEEVAESIVQQTGGKLSAVVITHRHKDHISGLVGAWDMLKDLKPDLVIEPWTESPEYARSAKSRPALFAGAMQSMQAACALAASEVQRMAAHAEPRAVAGIGMLAAAGDTQLARDLDKCLKEWGGPDGVNRRFVAKDDELDLSSVIPGVKVTVIGPPARLRKEGKPSSEWWPMAEGTLRTEPDAPLFPEAQTYGLDEEPAESRWFRRRMVSARSDQLLELVSLANTEVNNTSVILLMEVGGKKLLFPGDAEAEGWEEALQDDKLEALLRDVDVYKVGHHGSRNATPVTLWEGFKNRGHGMKAILSSKHTNKWPDVPRESLMDELAQLKKNLVSTIGKKRLFERVVVEIA